MLWGLLSYLSSLYSTAIIAASIRMMEAARIPVGFLVNSRYVFHFFIAAGLAMVVGKMKHNSWTVLLRPGRVTVQLARSATLALQTVGFYLQSFFIQVSTSNSLVVAHRTLFTLLLAPIFKEKVHKKWWVLSSTVVTFVGVGVMYLSTTSDVILDARYGTHALHWILSKRPLTDQASTNLFYGWLAVVLNTVSTAFGLHFNRAAHLSGENKWTTLYLSSIVGLLASSMFWFLGLPHLPQLSLPDFSGVVGHRTLLWLGVMIGFSILAQLFQQISAGKLETSTLVMFAPLQIPFGALLDWALFDKLPNGVMFIAMMLLVCGSLLGYPSMKEGERQRIRAKRQKVLRRVFTRAVWPNIGRKRKLRLIAVPRSLVASRV